MAFICYKKIKCKDCKYYRYDKDKDVNACFAETEEPENEYQRDMDEWNSKAS